MSEEYKLPKEQRAKDEAEISKITWSKGPYSFLLLRTQEKYSLKANQKRRLLLEQQLNLSFPMITDEMLLALYKYSCQKYLQDCHQKYNFSSGFGSTPSERKFAATLQAIVNANPILKHLEIYPSVEHSNDLPSNFKMVIGNYVPDFLIFGLKIKGASAVAIEIDGDFHVEKWSKDELRNAHLKQLKIFTVEIPNEQAADITTL